MNAHAQSTEKLSAKKVDPIVTFTNIVESQSVQEYLKKIDVTLNSMNFVGQSRKTVPGREWYSIHYESRDLVVLGSNVNSDFSKTDTFRLQIFADKSEPATFTQRAMAKQIADNLRAALRPMLVIKQ